MNSHLKSYTNQFKKINNNNNNNILSEINIKNGMLLFSEHN